MSLEAGLWQSFLGLRAAFRDKYITSEMMKTKFAGKLILYMVLVAAAVHVDVMAGSEGIFLKAAWYYLAGTEFISIAENLRDAGVQSLDPLLNFVRSKLGGMK
nr:phage holin family protein [Sporomusa sphaeroides]